MERMGHINWNDIQEVEAKPGIFRKIVTMGGIQIVQYRYLPGSIFDVHYHPEVQMTIGISGKLLFTVGDKTFKFVEGDIAHIPGNIPHSAVNKGKEEAVTLNIYNPARRSAP